MEEYAIYLRKSRADAEAEARGEGETLARHQNTLMELAKKRNLNVVKIYKEIVSGDSISARPQMQLMLSDIAEKKYTGVLVMEIERLARGNTIDQGIVAQAFKDSETLIITPVKVYNPLNEFDEEYFEFSLFMSRREYKTIKRRLFAGRVAATNEGNYIPSVRPYGYKKINPQPNIHTLEVVPEEADVIRLIYQLYLSGKGARAIASHLNNIGIKPIKAQYFEPPTIKKILSNPLYCGNVVWNKKICKGLHEAIISEETFNAAQYKRKNNPAAQIRNNDVLHNYYHNILYCKNCGHQLKRRSTKYNTHMLCRYRSCRGIVVSSSMQEIDNAVMTAIKFRLEELKQLKLENVENVEKDVENQIDLRKPLISELEKLKKQKDKLHDLLEREIYDVDTFIQRSKIISEKINAIEAQLKEIPELKQKNKISSDQAITSLQYVIEHFYSCESAEDKQKMLKSIINRIDYSKTQRMCRYNTNSDLTLEIDFV